MSSPYESMPSEEDDSSDKLNPYLLASVVLDVLDLSSQIEHTTEIQPTVSSYILALSGDNIATAAPSLPPELYGLLDDEQLSLIIISYAFGTAVDRPYMEIFLENDENSICTFSKPGVDITEPYNGSVIKNGKEYTFPVSNESVAQFCDDIIVPSLDNIPIVDPQFPPVARDIIDRLYSSQQADKISDALYTIPPSPTQKAYQVEVSYIDDNPSEVRIRRIIQDDLYMDENNQMIHAYAAVEARVQTLDFTQSVIFHKYSSHDESEEIKTDDGLLEQLSEDIVYLKQVFSHPDATDFAEPLTDY